MAIEKKKVIDIDTKNAQTGVRNLKQEIRELRTAMAGMEEGSEEWAQASQQLATALDKQRKIAEAGKFATQDFGNMLGNLASVGAGVAAGINGITSALSLMGVEVEKDDVGMIKFTQSMMAIVQALSTVDTATKAWDGLMSGLNALLDRKLQDTAETIANTAATEANTAAAAKNAAAKTAQAAASGKNAAAMGTEAAATAATSQKSAGLLGVVSKLGKVIKTSGKALGIWGVAITAVTILITKWIKTVNEAHKKEQELLELRKKMNDASVEAGSMLREYDATLHDNNASYESRLNALQHLRDAFPEYNAQLTEEGKLINDNNEYLKANISLIEQKAQAAALESDYVEALKEERRLNQEIADIESGKNTTWAQRFFFGDVFNDGSLETTDPLSKWLFGKGQESRLDDRQEELEEVQRNIKNIRDEYGKLGNVMAGTRLAAQTKFKDLNNQILQTKANIESTARSLQVLLSNYLSEMNKFENNNVETALQKFVNTIENAMTAAGKTSGEVFGEGVWEGVKETLKDSPDVMERFTKLITGNIQIALDNAANPEDYFKRLQESLTDVNGAFDTDIMDEWLASINEIVINGEKIPRKGFFNGTYLANLKKQLEQIISRYNQLAGANVMMSTATGEKYAQVINEWNRNYAEIYRQHQEYVTKSTALQNRYVELISQAGREMARGEEENYKKTMEIANAAWDESQSLIEADRNLKKGNEQTFQIMDEKYQAFVDATAALEKYNLQLAQSNDELTRLGLKKDALERQITMVQTMMGAYNELQETTNEQFKDAYDWYKKIVPEMAERIYLERQYRTELEAGNKDAAFNKRMGELELEKKQLEERIYLNRLLIDAMEALGGEDMSGVDMEKYQQIYEQINNDMQALNENQLSIEEETYAQRTQMLNRWWDEMEASYDQAYSDLETVMLQHDNLWNLGSEDYNRQMEELEAQKYFLDQKMAQLNSWREQDMINELDYLEKKKELDQQYADLDVKMQQETSNRKLKVFNTYYDGIKSITSAINGILSQAIEAEEENKEKQKELRIAQTWMTGIMGSIEALVSGIQSGIPAPGNFILGGVLSAATIAETVMAVNNIRKEQGTTSGAANINVPAYETLAYETNSNIEENVRDQRVYVVESDVQTVGQHVDTIESEAQF